MISLRAVTVDRRLQHHVTLLLTMATSSAGMTAKRPVQQLYTFIVSGYSGDQRMGPVSRR